MAGSLTPFSSLVYSAQGCQIRAQLDEAVLPRFVINQVPLWLFILAYHLGNFLRRLGLPKVIKDWSLSSLQVKLI